MISLATSKITDKVRENIQAVLNENRLGDGRFVKEFEKKVAHYVGAKHAITTCNGSMADIVSLAVLKEQRPGKKEVIVPALTFIAQPNSILINGLTPVFVDIGTDYQINTALIEEKITENTLAIFPVHLLGVLCNIFEIKRIAQKYNIFVVEDCCEAFGIYSNTDFGTYSFFPSHTITTGEGGMIVTNDDTHAEIARSIKNHGRKSDDILEKFHFNYLGYNGKMSNITAAIGCGVIDEADSVIEKRKNNVSLYNNFLEGTWFAESPHCYPYIYKSQEERDKALLRLEKNGIEARKLFSCIPTVEYRIPGSYPVAQEIGEKGLFLPVHQELTEEDIKKIVFFL